MLKSGGNVSGSESIAFLPFYQSDMNDDSSVLGKNIHFLQTLLNLDLISFIRQVKGNNSLLFFLQSYFAYRAKPYENHGTDKKYFLLDKLVFVVFRRISKFDNELHHANTLKQEKNESMESTIQNIKFLRFTYLLDLISLLGESNISLSKELIVDLMRIRPETSREFMISILECRKMIVEIASRLISCINYSKTTKTQADKNKPTADELQSFYKLFGDIVYSFGLFLQALDAKWLLESELFGSQSPKQLSEKYGMELFNISQILYEIILPLVCHLKLDQQDQTSVKLIEYWSLNTVKLLLSIASTTGSSFGGTSTVSVVSSGNSIDWMQIFTNRINLKTLFPNQSIDESILRTGSFISDYIEMYGPEDIRSLVIDNLGEEDVFASFLASITTEKFPSNQKTANANDMFQLNIPMKDDIQPVPIIDSNQMKIQNIKEIFPNFGEGFVESCLKYYNNNVEDVINALLTNNLPPQLQSIDRKIEKAWVGKKVQENQMEDEYSRIREENKQFNKEFLKAMQQKQMKDAQIIDREYDDDYDDQYDDVVPKATAFQDEDNRSSSQRHNWQQKMEDTKRYNDLLKEEEKEIQYWEDMKNTNKRNIVSSRDNWKRENDEEGEEDEGDSKDLEQGIKSLNVTQDSNQTRPGQVGKGKKDAKSKDAKPATVESQTADTVKSEKSGPQHYRTKTHDKHHQKDKALKKMGRF